MRKWRISCNLMNHKKIKNEETGITLVELLAAISILSIVILLAGSVHMFGQRQFIDQTKSASQANDLSYAMTVMSKDLRKKEAGKIKVESNKISEENGGIPVELYSLENNQLKKGSTVLAEDITGAFKLKIEIVEYEGEKISIIEGVHLNLKDRGSTIEYDTTVYFRR